MFKWVLIEWLLHVSYEKFLVEPNKGKIKQILGVNIAGAGPLRKELFCGFPNLQTNENVGILDEERVRCFLVKETKRGIQVYTALRNHNRIVY